MNISIKFENTTDNTSLELDSLYHLLYENDMKVELITAPSKEMNAKEVATATLITLALTSISTLVDVLTFFQSQNKHSLSFKYKGKTIVLNNLSEKQQEEKIKKILNLKDQEAIEFIIVD